MQLIKSVEALSKSVPNRHEHPLHVFLRERKELLFRPIERFINTPPLVKCELRHLARQADKIAFGREVLDDTAVMFNIGGRGNRGGELGHIRRSSDLGKGR